MITTRIKTSIKEELTSYINDNKNEYTDELHFHLFNQDYYIIGYYQAQQWLDKHGISVFEALETIRDMNNLILENVNTTQMQKKQLIC